MICLPTSVEPVKAILSTRGSRTMAMPILPPGPVTTFSTPSGSPASWQSSWNLSAVSGVCDAGLMTTVLPAASAGASFQDESRKGKFHGTMASDHRSWGWRSVKVKAVSRSCRVSPWILLAHPA